MGLVHRREGGTSESEFGTAGCVAQGLSPRVAQAVKAIEKGSDTVVDGLERSAHHGCQRSKCRG